MRVIPDFTYTEIDGIERATLDAKKHATFRRDMNKALRQIRVATFLRNRPDADRYVLAEYKRGAK